jgi:Antibiotic biosynthesis monooxygenase
VLALVAHAMILVALAAVAEGSDVLTKISTNSSVITLINVFTVEPANQQRLVELLTEATEVSVCRAPGFVSASSIAVQTAQRSTMHAQWQNIDQYQTMRQNPGPLPFLQGRSRSPNLNPASTRSCEPSHPPTSQIETMRRRLLCANTVAKVENRTTPNISRKSIFTPLYRCKAL